MGETSGTRIFLSLTSCCLCLWRRPAHLETARSTRIFYLWRRPAHLATAHAICVATATAYLLSLATDSVPGDGPRNLCGDRDRVSVIFGDGQRTWRRPTQFVWRPRPRIFYLWQRPAHLATAHAICVATATATAYLLSLATASAPGDGPRNVLTPGNTKLGETSGTRNFLSLTSCCL